MIVERTRERSVWSAGGDSTGFLLIFLALIAAVPSAVAPFVDDRGWQAVRRTFIVGLLASVIGTLFALLGTGRATGLVAFPGLVMIAFSTGFFLLGLRSIIASVRD